MDNNVAWLLSFMFFWQLILTVAFVLHWIKIERNMNFDKHLGSRVSDSLRSKVIGK